MAVRYGYPSREPTPNTESTDYELMKPIWEKITDIMSGVDAIKAKTTLYLPTYDEEDHDSYQLRLNAAPWRPEFVDAVGTICAKPFTKNIALQGDEYSESIKAFAEDVDGQGNNLHVFARNVFRDAVSLGLSGIYVAYPDVEPAATKAEEQARGARPYWVHLRATDIIACYFKMIDTGEVDPFTGKMGSREVIEHLRYRDYRVERDGFGEVEKCYIRVLELDENNQPTSRLYEKAKDPNTPAQDAAGHDSALVEVVANATAPYSERWEQVGDTVVLEGVPEIPVVLFFTGERFGHYRVRPPLSDLAEMQMEIYRAMSRKEEVLTYAGSPMLAANGMKPPEPTYATDQRTGEKMIINENKITVGPKRVLFAPPTSDGVQTSWSWVQPNPGAITEIRNDVSQTIDDFRRLAMQPMTARSGQVTATGQAIEGAKAHSQIEAWAMTFKDSLEQAFVYTSQWMNEPENVEVFVHTDFGVDLEASDMSDLLASRMGGQISQRTYWDELLRRGKLGPQFDPEEEEGRLQEEAMLAAGMPGAGGSDTYDLSGIQASGGMEADFGDEAANDNTNTDGSGDAVDNPDTGFRLVA